MLSDWNCRTPNTDMSNLEESWYDYKKNYLWKKKHFEILRLQVRTRWEKWREVKNYESTSSQYKNYEKVMRQYRGSLHKCRKFKRRWIAWTTLENFKKWNRITVGDSLTFPVVRLMTNTLSRNSVRFQCMSVQGHLLQEVKNELEAQSQCRHLQEGRRPWILICQWVFHSKDSRYRIFNLINSPHFQSFHVGR